MRAGAPSLSLAVLTVALMAAGFSASQRSGGSFARRPGEARERGSGRGRSASAPSEIPARGWKDVLLRVYGNIGEHRVVALAAGVTFYSILALFPATAALVALYGLFADPASIAARLDSLADVLPGGAVDILGGEMRRIAAQGSSTLSLTFIGSLLLALWSANAGVKSFFDTLNLVYREREKRGFITLNAISLAFTASAIVFFLLAIGGMVVLPIVLDRIGLGGGAELLLKVLRWPVLLLLVMFGLSCLYRFGPSRANPKWRWVTWGSAAAAIAWLAASLLFSWYAANVGSYNKTYGSLGAMIGFMIWIWLSAIVVLLGAELNAELEHQSARDTTTGSARSLGRRGATMADTVGAEQ